MDVQRSDVGDMIDKWQVVAAALKLADVQDVKLVERDVGNIPNLSALVVPTGGEDVPSASGYVKREYPFVVEIWRRAKISEAYKYVETVENAMDATIDNLNSRTRVLYVEREPTATVDDVLKSTNEKIVVASATIGLG